MSHLAEAKKVGASDLVKKTEDKKDYFFVLKIVQLITYDVIHLCIVQSITFLIVSLKLDLKFGLEKTKQFSLQVIIMLPHPLSSLFTYLILTLFCAKLILVRPRHASTCNQYRELVIIDLSTCLINWVQKGNIDEISVCR